MKNLETVKMKSTKCSSKRVVLYLAWLSKTPVYADDVLIYFNLKKCKDHILLYDINSSDSILSDLGKDHAS